MTSNTSAPPAGGMVRNFMHLGLGQAATTILTILLSYVLAKKLSLPDIGLLYLVTSIATFAYVVVDWGHGSLIIRETARHPDRSGDVMGSAVAVRTVCALVACVLSVGTTWLLGYEWLACLLTGTLILAWLPQYLGLSFGWVFRGRERMDRDAQLNVALKLVTLIGSVVCLQLGAGLFGLVFAWGLAGCITLWIGIAMHRNLRLPALVARMSTVRTLMRDGTPIFAMSLAVAVQPVLNANILFKMSSSTVVGWYGPAWVIAGTLVAPATVLGAAMYPRMSAAAGDSAEFKRIFDMSFRPLLLLAVLGAAGTWLFAEVPVDLIYGLQKFGPTADTLRAFAPVLLLMYVDMFLTTALLAVGKAGRLAGVKMASVVLTTALALLFVPIFQAHHDNGGLGLMYAMAIGELLMFIASLIMLREAIDGRTFSDLIRSLLPGVATVLLFQYLPALNPFLAIPLCVLVFGMLALVVGAVKRSDIAMLVPSFCKSGS